MGLSPMSAYFEGPQCFFGGTPGPAGRPFGTSTSDAEETSWLDVDLMLTCFSCFSFGFRYPHPILPLILTVHLNDGGIMMSNMMWHIVTFSYFNAEPGTHDTKVCQVLSLPIPWCNQRRHMHQPPQWHQSLVTETFVVCGLCGSLNSWPQLATAGHSSFACRILCVLVVPQNSPRFDGMFLCFWKKAGSPASHSSQPRTQGHLPHNLPARRVILRCSRANLSLSSL